MSAAITAFFLAQSLASAAPASNQAPAPRRSVVAEQVTARATILRPARIHFTDNAARLQDERKGERNLSRQSERDAAGTVWVEFS